MPAVERAVRGRGVQSCQAQPNRGPECRLGVTIGRVVPGAGAHAIAHPGEGVQVSVVEHRITGHRQPSVNRQPRPTPARMTRPDEQATTLVAGPPSIQTLQRAAGNAAVAQLVRALPSASAPGVGRVRTTPLPTAVVQRVGDLAAKAGIDTFVTSIRASQRVTGKGTSSRANQVEAIPAYLLVEVNKLLPYPCELQMTAGGESTGQFDSKSWTIKVNPQWANSPDAPNAPLTTKQITDLAATIYHEARHAEQRFLVVRSRIDRSNEAGGLREKVTSRLASQLNVAADKVSVDEIRTAMVAELASQCNVPPEVVVRASTFPALPRSESPGSRGGAGIEGWEAFMIGKLASYRESITGAYKQQAENSRPINLWLAKREPLLEAVKDQGAETTRTKGQPGWRDELKLYIQLRKDLAGLDSNALQDAEVDAEALFDMHLKPRFTDVLEPLRQREAASAPLQPYELDVLRRLTKLEGTDKSLRETIKKNQGTRNEAERHQIGDQVRDAMEAHRDALYEAYENYAHEQDAYEVQHQLEGAVGASPVAPRAANAVGP